jgi:hypothetical protein
MLASINAKVDGIVFGHLVWIHNITILSTFHRKCDTAERSEPAAHLSAKSIVNHEILDIIPLFDQAQKSPAHQNTAILRHFANNMLAGDGTRW